MQLPIRQPRRPIAPAIKFLWIVAGLTSLAVLGWVGYNAFAPQIWQLAFVPSKAFAESIVDSQPNYALNSAWAAHPDMPSASLEAPKGYRAAPKPAVDVFFIPPTTYISRERWNAPLTDTESNRRLSQSLRHQANVFNGVGRLWVPRYRHATFGAFLTQKPDAKKAFDLAYSDVKTAFAVFIATHGDRPFILAGHSQGSMHGLRLLQEEIAGHPLQQKMVAAYLIGWPISTEADLAPFNLDACTTPAATGCVISWQSFGKPADTSVIMRTYNATTGPTGIARANTDLVCINPITWWRDRRLATKDANLGSLAYAKTGEPVGDLIPALTGAACQADGFLHLSDPPGAPFRELVMSGENYHTYDYNLFWADIRANVETRIETFFTPVNDYTN